MSKEVVRKLKAARAKLGLTQKDLGKKLGIPMRTIIKWENDQATPHALTWEAVEGKLAAILAEH